MGLKRSGVERSVQYVLFILIGGVFPHAFMTPPRNIGIYVTSHLENAGSCCVYHNQSVLMHMIQRRNQYKAMVGNCGFVRVQCYEEESYNMAEELENVRE